MHSLHFSAETSCMLEAWCPFYVSCEHYHAVTRNVVNFVLTRLHFLRRQLTKIRLRVEKQELLKLRWCQ